MVQVIIALISLPVSAGFLYLAYAAVAEWYRFVLTDVIESKTAERDGVFIIYRPPAPGQVRPSGFFCGVPGRHVICWTPFPANRQGDPTLMSEAILLHELGHYRLKHFELGFVWQALFCVWPVSLALVAVFTTWHWLVPAIVLIGTHIVHGRMLFAEMEDDADEYAARHYPDEIKILKQWRSEQ